MCFSHTPFWTISTTFWRSKETGTLRDQNREPRGSSQRKLGSQHSFLSSGNTNMSLVRLHQRGRAHCGRAVDQQQTQQSREKLDMAMLVPSPHARAAQFSQCSTASGMQGEGCRHVGSMPEPAGAPGNHWPWGAWSIIRGQARHWAWQHRELSWALPCRAMHVLHVRLASVPAELSRSHAIPHEHWDLS